MSDIAIRVEGLSKAYQITQTQTRSRYKTLQEDLLALPRRLWSTARGKGPQRETFWALKDVSFEVKQGEVLGVIGRNGAGKSTLLKILSNITEPTSGRAEIYGRVGSLLEVGTGFHPELTGRENVFLNGAILGMMRRDVKANFDQIVAFAEVEQFIDTPVKYYSSGMYMRLAFAVAAHLEPEILLVDEVLAVGDIAFQKKCLGKMEAVAHGGRTVLFVSHNLQAVRALCSRSLLIREGRLASVGPTAEVITEYHANLAQSEVTTTTAVTNPTYRRGSGAVRFGGIRLQDEHSMDQFEFIMGQTIRFWMAYQVFSDVWNLYLSVALRSGKSSEYITSVRHVVSEGPLAAGQVGAVMVDLPNPAIRPGEYGLYFWLGNRVGQAYDVIDGLTAPIRIVTDRDYEQLGFDPTLPSDLTGYVNIESHLRPS